MCAPRRGAAGVARVLQALDGGALVAARFSSRVHQLVRIVTDSLRRSSRAVALTVGVAGVSLAATLYLSQTVSGIVAIAIGGYALACATLLVVLGDSSRSGESNLFDHAGQVPTT